MVRERREKAFSDVWEWFKGFTTLGGFIQYNASTNTLSQVYWYILFLGGFCGTIYGVYDSVYSFFQYNVLTYVSLKHNYSLPFPSVTVCNANRIHCGYFNKFIENCHKNDTCRLSKEEEYCKLFLLADCKTSVQIADTFSYGEVLSDIGFCDNYNFDDIDTVQEQLDLNKLTAEFYDLYLRLDEEVLFKIAHQPETMIKSCLFGNDPTNKGCSEFRNNSLSKKIFSPRYGVCNIFNYGDITVSEGQIGRLVSTYDGPDYGLSLTIDLESGYYMRYGLTQTRGVKIVLQEQSKLPSVLSRPLEIAPNKMTNIGIRMTNVTRLKLPYVSNCTTSYPDFFAREYHMSDQIKYSDLACSNLCLQTATTGYCNCSDPMVMEARFNFNNSLNFCSTDQETKKRRCVNNAQKNYTSQSTVPCPCRPDCTTTFHDTTIAATEWPSGIDWALVAENNNVTYRNTTIRYNIALKLEANSSIWSSGGMTEYNMIKDHVTENFLQVNVFFEDLNVNLITEKAEYTFTSFLSTLGGAISIYLGTSLVSSMEGLELVVRYIAAALKTGPVERRRRT